MMGVLPDWFEQHWSNYKHERLYAWVRTEAKGAGEVEATAEEMVEFATLMSESVDDVEQALAEAQVSWQGLTADSMNSGVSPLAQWARDASTATEASVDSARQVGDSFAYASRSMPEPVPTPDRVLPFPPTFADLVAAQQDHDATERAAQEAKQHAVELMDTYSSTSAAAADSLGVFVPPQGVTVAAPEPPGGSADAAFGSIDGPAGRDTGDGDSEPAGPGDGDRQPGPGDGDPAVRVADQPGDPALPGTGVGSATDPSRVTVPQAPTPVAGPPAPASTAPPVGSPVTLFVGGPGGGEPGGGRGASGGQGRGPAGGQGRGPVAGLPGRGVNTGGEPVAATRGGTGAGARPGATGFGGPMGAGRRGEEDKERTSPDYLRDYRDDFWDDTPPVAPAVIGEEDDD